MTAGRPTEYNENMKILAEEYIASCQDRYDGDLKRMVVKIPTVEGLAFHLNISRSTLYLWAGQHPEFSDTLERLKQYQAERLINKGLSGEYTSPIAKLLLHGHGYSDKSEVDLTSKGERMGTGLSEEEKKKLDALFPEKPAETATGTAPDAVIPTVAAQVVTTKKDESLPTTQTKTAA